MQCAIWRLFDDDDDDDDDDDQIWGTLTIAIILLASLLAKCGVRILK